MAEFVSLVLESDQGLIYIYVWVDITSIFGVGRYLILIILYMHTYLSDKSIDLVTSINLQFRELFLKKLLFIQYMSRLYPQPRQINEG
jgi:hypothetical protein